tara:strand:- start:393 stop:707 length:315 start_codon:yes stop_codon:yes gene_type:complete
MFKELNEDILSEVIIGHDKVVVQFSAGWCGNCRVIKPKFKKLSENYEDVEFIIIDAEKNPNSRKLAKVDNLPTFAAFEKGLLKRQIQTNKSDVLKSFLDEITNN